VCKRWDTLIKIAYAEVSSLGQFERLLKRRKQRQLDIIKDVWHGMFLSRLPLNVLSYRNRVTFLAIIVHARILVAPMIRL
jgi:hypothetical protein